MHILSQGTVLLCDDPRQAAQFYIQHLGFQAVVELDWYVSLQHPDLPGIHLDLLHRAHEANSASQRHQPTSGILLGFMVEDAAREEKRLSAAGLTITKPLTDESWGQRRFQVLAPDGVIVEVLQTIPPDPTWLAQQGR
ncbi:MULTISPECIES: VOC family protein [Deinococcus]|uniref:VOC domain-containing protein n=1 Tax=Deinococcus cavernae TaxID=2320857 RepID=A0A418V8Z1_9DEIO|nr:MULTISPECIES: VOC family protein [Deinococcus]RJF72537.1 hypothetical protein D3875_14265 [Deinococcus cavernae]